MVQPIGHVRPGNVRTMRRPLALVVTVTLLALGACSGGTGPAPEPTPAPTSAEAAVTLDDLNPEAARVAVPDDLDIPGGTTEADNRELAERIAGYLERATDTQAMPGMSDGDAVTWVLEPLGEPTARRIRTLVADKIEDVPEAITYASRTDPDDPPQESRVLRVEWDSRVENGELRVSGQAWIGHQYDDGIVLTSHQLELRGTPGRIAGSATGYGFNIFVAFRGTDTCRLFVDGVFVPGPQETIAQNVDAFRDFFMSGGDTSGAFPDGDDEDTDPVAERRKCLDGA